MDPNATIARLCDACDDLDADEICDAIADLDEWAEMGGFAPRDYDYEDVVTTVERAAELLATDRYVRDRLRGLVAWIRALKREV